MFQLLALRSENWCARTKKAIIVVSKTRKTSDKIQMNIIFPFCSSKNHKLLNCLHCVWATAPMCVCVCACIRREFPNDKFYVHILFAPSLSLFVYSCRLFVFLFLTWASPKSKNFLHLFFGFCLFDSVVSHFGFSNAIVTRVHVADEFVYSRNFLTERRPESRSLYLLRKVLLLCNAALSQHSVRTMRKMYIKWQRIYQFQLSVSTFATNFHCNENGFDFQNYTLAQSQRNAIKPKRNLISKQIHFINSLVCFGGFPFLLLKIKWFDNSINLLDTRRHLRILISTRLRFMSHFWQHKVCVNLISVRLINSNYFPFRILFGWR